MILTALINLLHSRYSVYILSAIAVCGLYVIYRVARLIRHWYLYVTHKIIITEVLYENFNNEYHDEKREKRRQQLLEKQIEFEKKPSNDMYQQHFRVVGVVEAIGKWTDALIRKSGVKYLMRAQAMKSEGGFFQNLLMLNRAMNSQGRKRGVGR